MTGVRWTSELGEYEGLCEGCMQYWPITPEFWRRDRTRRCKACEIARARVMDERRKRAEVISRSDPVRLERRRSRNREWMRAYRARAAAA